MNNEKSLYETIDMKEEDTTADRGIIPAEVAARREREGSDFRKTANEQADPESINVTGGATVDQEGLANNYAIEPEMYADEPGDLKREHAIMKPTPITSKLQKIRASEFLNSNSLIQI